MLFDNKYAFNDLHGYDHERESLKSLGVKRGDVFTLVDFEEGNWHTDYKFEELPGWHNSVMFDRVWSEPALVRRIGQLRSQLDEIQGEIDEFEEKLVEIRSAK